jgi:hypothetical protein
MSSPLPKLLLVAVDDVEAFLELIAGWQLAKGIVRPQCDWNLENSKNKYVILI